MACAPSPLSDPVAGLALAEGGRDGEMRPAIASNVGFELGGRCGPIWGDIREMAEREALRLWEANTKGDGVWVRREEAGDWEISHRSILTSPLSTNFPVDNSFA